MPNRATELRWDAEDASGGLSRAAIVEAAMRIADADGLEAVSIRRVAADLGARPMSLYTHIASKDDLVDLMLNQAIAAIVLPEPLPDDWRTALRAIAHQTHTAFRTHPWTLKAAGRPRPMGPTAHRHAEQTAQAGALIGLPQAEVDAAVTAVDAYTLGYALIEFVRDRRGEGRIPPVDFEAGLELVLDGIAARLDR